MTEPVKPTTTCDNCGCRFEYEGRSMPMYCDLCEDWFHWTRIKTLTADRERCLEALRPLAAWAKRIDTDESARKLADWCPLRVWPERISQPFFATVGHLRAAAALVAEMDEAKTSTLPVTPPTNR